MMGSNQSIPVLGPFSFLSIRCNVLHPYETLKQSNRSTIFGTCTCHPLSICVLDSLYLVLLFSNCLCTERNHRAGAVKTKAYHGATREAPKTNSGIDVVGMVEWTAAATPPLPAHMELMLTWFLFLKRCALGIPLTNNPLCRPVISHRNIWITYLLSL